MKKSVRWIFILLLVLVSAYLIPNNQSLPLDSLFPEPTEKIPKIKTSITPNPANLQRAHVAKVIDGDTIEIDSGQKVRYIGIDAPETKDPRRSLQCFGEEAFLKNKKLVEDREVTLEKDVSETDKFGRLLRYVYVKGIFVNEYLVKEGYAQVSTFPPDVKYVNVFLEAQREARENNLGLWKKC